MSILDGSMRVSATGDLPPEHAWARYTQPRRWPEWAPQVREVDYPHEVVRAGTHGRVRGPGGLVAVFTVDAVDPAARTWSWSVRSGPLRVSFDHGVEPVGGAGGPGAAGGGSTAWAVVRGPWPVVVGYVPVARWALGRLVAGTR